MSRRATAHRKMNVEPKPENSLYSRYVSGPRLLETMFEEQSRPSLRSLRDWQANGLIPYVKLGRLVFFDPVAVKAALEKRRTLRARV